jgi:hypothetical protein
VNEEIKMVATVRDVARLVGLSPARFYQLLKAGIFPQPIYDITTKRPCYTEEQQLICVEVRRKNCGINGKPVLFYARRLDGAAAPSRPRPRTVPVQKDNHTGLIESLKELGLTNVTAKEVTTAMKIVFPKGVEGVSEPEVIRQVFLHLKRQD